MGMWIAAARLGLGFRSGLGLAGGRRRFNTTSAAAAIDANKSLRSIYLCFNEWNGYEYAYYRNHVIRRIGLETSTANANATANGEEELPVIANKISRSKDSFPTRFSTLNSKIVFPLNESGDICWFDSSKPTPEIQVSSPTDATIRSFYRPKYRVHFGEVSGKLYSVSVDPLSEVIDPNPDYIYSSGDDPSSQLFEVFNPVSLQWRPLPTPPFVFGTIRCRYPNSIWRETLGYEHRSFHQCETRFLDESKKIIGWISGEPQVWCFDATNLESEWKKLDNPYLNDTIPFASASLFIHTQHQDFGDFYLIFTYKPLRDPLCLYPCFMSNTCDSFHPIDQPIPLPELCFGYIHSEYETLEDDNVYSCQLLNLGDQKVGLVINTFSESHGLVLLVTFEYDVKVTVDDFKPNIEIQTRLLGTRRFKYSPMDPPEYCVYDKVDELRLDGAFLV